MCVEIITSMLKEVYLPIRCGLLLKDNEISSFNNWKSCTIYNWLIVQLIYKKYRIIL